MFFIQHLQTHSFIFVTFYLKFFFNFNFHVSLHAWFSQCPCSDETAHIDSSLVMLLEDVRNILHKVPWAKYCGRPNFTS